MSVKSIMSTKLVTIDQDANLKTIKQMFEKVNFRHLLVEEKGELCGIISDRDLFRALNPKVDSIYATDKDLACLNKKAHQIMSRHPLCLSPESTIFDAVHLFNHNKVSCIPIVNQANHAVGIVSWRDILRALERKMLENQRTGLGENA